MMNFKECRERAGLTQKEAAISLDVSIQAVSYWETGSRVPSVEKILQMCDLYNVTADYLLGRTPMDIEVIHGDPPPLGDDEVELVFEQDEKTPTADELERMIVDIVRRELKNHNKGR